MAFRTAFSRCKPAMRHDKLSWRIAFKAHIGQKRQKILHRLVAFQSLEIPAAMLNSRLFRNARIDTGTAVPEFIAELMRRL